MTEQKEPTETIHPTPNPKAPSITIGGTSYELHELPEGDYDVLDQWCRDRHINMADGKSERMMAVALSQAASMTHEFGEGFRHMLSLPGIAKLTWHHLSGEDRRKVTPQEIEHALRDKKARKQSVDAINTFRPGGTKADADETQKKTTPVEQSNTSKPENESGVSSASDGKFAQMS